MESGLQCIPGILRSTVFDTDHKIKKLKLRTDENLAKTFLILLESSSRRDEMVATF